jgi:glycosyltransferase involved in cell wall biosynthesis
MTHNPNQMKPNTPDLFPENLICFSHLRWDFVYQRPQHLLSRFSQGTKVWFFEEPVFDAVEKNYLSIKNESDTLNIVVPHLLQGLSDEKIVYDQSLLLKQLGLNVDLSECIFWYYTPMALKFSAEFKPKFIVYDCMDELSAFKFAPKELVQLEKTLMARADIVFTGGQSLFEAKKKQHNNIHPFPSGIEKEHFTKARTQIAEPADQIKITGPKLGFYGVIDERFDIELIRQMAEARPHWQFMLIGPIVKIDRATLPQRKNIHYLGQKTYQELPAYLAHWNIAMIPFLINESTKFISPTKTPEYLAGGVPVVSSAITDVVNPYGKEKLVHICSSTSEFISAAESELNKGRQKLWLAKADNFLKGVSWDATYQTMYQKIALSLAEQKISIAS